MATTIVTSLTIEKILVQEVSPQNLSLFRILFVSLSMSDEMTNSIYHITYY